MYTTYFGFREEPFNITPDPGSFMPTLAMKKRMQPSLWYPPAERLYFVDR